jgi:methionyl-tRNA formyltransferase
MKKYVIVSEKKWHFNLENELNEVLPNTKWITIKNFNDFNPNFLNKIKPAFIFIPHWSYLIPEEIFLNFNCIVFHMTDLPFGRGGSPLQNLIKAKFKKTKITAIKVEKGIDAGDIYLKNELSLEGTAREIFEKSSIIIKNMIVEILTKNIKSIPQIGEATNFKRLKPEDGILNELNDLEIVFDYIRMLDCDGYPPAYVETENLKFEFSNAKHNKKSKLINANVRIFKK